MVLILCAVLLWLYLSHFTIDLFKRLINIDSNFQVKGFVSKMEEYMGACDCIITKVPRFRQYIF